MPNHVTNVVTFHGEQDAVSAIRQHVASPDRLFDFLKVFPMPECLEDYNPHSGIESRVKNALGIPPHDHGLIAKLEAENRVRDCFTEAKPEDIPLIIRGIENYQKCGFIYWYEWGNKEWGTKWNAYELEDRDGAIKFETARAHPAKVFLELSRQFPGVRIAVEYADEDIGSNCGVVEYEAGKLTKEDVAGRWSESGEDEKRKWAAFALKLNNYDQTVDEYMAEISE